MVTLTEERVRMKSDSIDRRVNKRKKTVNEKWFH
ncbi:hypothetical protein JOC76_000501 [Neobacillus cucumis]|nr:hypothetical protein [Neobacillus cucumis]